jgi:hypothetical protein
MSLPKAFLTIALCFGLGLGLAPTLRSAQACSCLDEDFWKLELEQISGDGELAVEQGFWTTDALLTEGDLLLKFGDTLCLRRIP